MFQGREFTLCYITGENDVASVSRAALLAAAVDCGVDLIQIRQKHPPVAARALMQLAAPVVESARGSRSHVVINDRVDIALALGAAGAHLGAQSLPARIVRPIVTQDFLIGVSCHSLAEALEAEAAGADYLLLGPVFETPSKLAYGPPLGLDRFGQIASKIEIPTLALGGITLERVKPCLESGAAGIAAIRLFEEAPSLPERVAKLRAARG